MLVRSLAQFKKETKAKVDLDFHACMDRQTYSIFLLFLFFIKFGQVTTKEPIGSLNSRVSIQSGSLINS